MVTASIGVASATGGDIEYAGVYRRADQALYRAKAAGRNRVVADETGEGAPVAPSLREEFAALTSA